MKKLVFAAAFLFAACGTHENYHKATDALDAGREYIDACLKGDFIKAAFYSLPDEKNRQLLNETEKLYRENDREGRQQLRTASINIQEIKDSSDGITVIRYSNSFDKKIHRLIVVKQGDTWLADLTKN